MALIGQETVNNTYDKRNRGWRLTIDTPWASNDSAAYKAAIRLTNHREIILVDQDTGEKFREENKYVVQKKYSDIEYFNCPVVGEDGTTLVSVPAAETQDDIGIYDQGDGTYTVRLTGGMAFALVAYMVDALGIAEAP